MASLEEKRRRRDENIRIDERKALGKLLEDNIMRTDNRVTKLWVLSDFIKALLSGERPEGM